MDAATLYDGSSTISISTAYAYTLTFDLWNTFFYKESSWADCEFEANGCALVENGTNTIVDCSPVSDSTVSESPVSGTCIYTKSSYGYLGPTFDYYISM